jgi:hypothetical protein
MRELRDPLVQHICRQRSPNLFLTCVTDCQLDHRELATVSPDGVFGYPVPDLGTEWKLLLPRGQRAGYRCRWGERGLVLFIHSE